VETAFATVCELSDHMPPCLLLKEAGGLVFPQRFSLIPQKTGRSPCGRFSVHACFIAATIRKAGTNPNHDHTNPALTEMPGGLHDRSG
jgi:hypothetical protein